MTPPAPIPSTPASPPAPHPAPGIHTSPSATRITCPRPTAGTGPAAAPPFPAGVSDTVQVTDSGTPPYAAFVANHPALTDTSPTADPDHDNLPTLIELVLGTDPTVADFPSPLQLTTTATKLRLTFPVDRRAVDTGTTSPVTFSGQISTTLRTRNPLPARSLSGGLYRIETDITPVAPRLINLHATQ